MRKVFISIVSAAVLLPAFPVRAQRSGNFHSTFQMSLLTPVGTNGTASHLYTNDVSLNILWGVSAGERAAAIGGFANVVLKDARGFQAAGVANYIGGNGCGMTAAGAANIVRRDYIGAQFAGAMNAARDMVGAQFAGVINRARDIDRGFQAAGTVNIAREIDGMQMAGTVNIAREIDGVQLAGAVNIARDVDGMQMAGVVNIARNVEGVQIGVVNIARRNDTPIGLVNIIRDGDMGIGFGYNEIGTASVNFRSGGRVLYGIVGLGYNDRAREFDNSRSGVSFIGGLGAHINVAPWLHINNELTSERIGKWRGEKVRFEPLAGLGRLPKDGDRYDTGVTKASYALLPAFRIGRVEIFGGPSINYLHCRYGENYGISSTLWEKEMLDGRFQMLYIGWQAGVQFLIKRHR